jgi:hypothetical protein
MKILTIALGALLILPPAAGANPDPVQVNTLKGLKVLNVIVEQGDYAKAGLSQDYVKTTIEMKLRSARFTVDPKASDAAYFRCQIFEIPGGRLSYHIELQVLQAGELKRDHDIFTYSPTWALPLYGTVEKSEARDKITNSLTDMLTRLLTDYLAANR